MSASCTSKCPAHGLRRAKGFHPVTLKCYTYWEHDTAAQPNHEHGVSQCKAEGKAKDCALVTGSAGRVEGITPNADRGRRKQRAARWRAPRASQWLCRSSLSAGHAVGYTDISERVAREATRAAGWQRKRKRVRARRVARPHAGGTPQAVCPLRSRHSRSA